MIGEERRIAGRCPNCGEEGLRDKAQFCDNCGVRLPKSTPEIEGSDNGSSKERVDVTTVGDKQTTHLGPVSDTAKDAGATSQMPQNSAAGDDNRSVSMPSTEPVTAEDFAPEVDEGATQFMAKAPDAEDEGATGFLPPPKVSMDEGATQFMAKAPDAEDEGATGLPPPTEVSADEGATQFMAKAPDAEDEGATDLLPPTEVSADEGATRLIAGQPDTEDEGMPRLVPGEVSLEDEGATIFIPPSPAEIADEGATKVVTDDARISPAVVIDAVVDHSVDFLDTSDDSRPEAKHVLELHHRYQLSNVLGKGGFGAVFLAEDVKIRRRCVVKQMLSRGKSPKEIDVSRLNFEREARLLVDLNDPGHPNIPEIYDFFSVDSGNYLVMKYIEGQNLKDALEQSNGKIPWREAVRYAIDVCSALNYMHTHGPEPVLHRDIKPANIQLGDDGRVWLVDFGLAKADPVKGSVENGMVTQASGSFGYTPLEQWIGQAVSGSDVYALGATLHHLVTGLNPLEAFEGEFHIQKIQDLHGDFVPIRKVDRKLPKGLDDIIKKAVDPDPNKRPTALQLQQQLVAVISGGQETALYTFKNGKSAGTVEELVDLCEKNRQEAEEYLYRGDFERWFLLINRNDLVAAARQAFREGETQQDGLERFLRLILPNLFRRRVKRVGLHIVRGALQVTIIAIFVFLLVAIGGSYVASLFIQQTIGSAEWPFHQLSLNKENVFNEDTLNESFNAAAGIYFDDDIAVDLVSPDRLDLRAIWNNISFYVPISVRLEDKKPHFFLTEVNGIPLFFITDNMSRGINRGVDQAFQRAPVDVTSMIVDDGAITFDVELSGRTPFATPTPAPTPTPTPRPTPTPVDAALVVIFNELDQDVILDISGDTWSESLDIGGNDKEVIEVPAGIYNYTVILAETGEIISQGTRTWTLKQAYRLRIGALQ